MRVVKVFSSKKLSILWLYSIMVLSSTFGVTAFVESVQGRVELRMPQVRDWIPVTPGIEIPLGATIATSVRASVQVQIGGTLLDVLPLTRITLEALIQEHQTTRTEFLLPVGRVRA